VKLPNFLQGGIIVHGKFYVENVYIYIYIYINLHIYTKTIVSNYMKDHEIFEYGNVINGTAKCLRDGKRAS